MSIRSARTFDGVVGMWVFAPSWEAGLQLIGLCFNGATKQSQRAFKEIEH